MINGISHNYGYMNILFLMNGNKYMLCQLTYYFEHDSWVTLLVTCPTPSKRPCDAESSCCHFCDTFLTSVSL